MTTEQLIKKAQQVLNREDAPQYRESFFARYPQFRNLRYFVLNFDQLDTMRAIEDYVAYMKNLNASGVEKNLPYIRESITFIRQFCEEHNLTLNEYANFIPDGKVTEAFWIHVKDRNVSQYALALIPSVVKKVLTCDFDEYKYYLEDSNDFQNKVSELSSSQHKHNLQKLLENPSKP